MVHAACHQDDGDPPARGPDGGGVDGGIADGGRIDGSTAVLDSGVDARVECCTPAAQPSCCMDYGGVKMYDTCGVVCDGMPYPSDPAWRLVNDTFGCPKWTSAGATGPCCGGKLPAPDAGPQHYQCYGDPY